MTERTEAAREHARRWCEIAAERPNDNNLEHALVALQTFDLQRKSDALPEVLPNT